MNELPNQSSIPGNISEPQITAEKIVTREQEAQNYVWRGPTDQEVNELSSYTKDNIGDLEAPTSYRPASLVATEYASCLNLVNLTKTSRLIDLGSADGAILYPGSLAELCKIGITEYVGVDIAFGKNSNFIIQNLGEELKVQTLRMEILEALHAMPENYGNVVSMGLDAIIFSLNHDWILAVLAEMKRVVPEGGIIFTDGMYLDLALSRCSSKFKEVVEMIKWRGASGLLTREEQELKRIYLSKYECATSDQYSKLGVVDDGVNNAKKPGVKYFVDMPEIGFRVYFDDISGMSPMFIVNVNKERAK